MAMAQIAFKAKSALPRPRTVEAEKEAKPYENE